MAASRLPAPGTEYGPCKNKCQHRDCQQMKDMAETKCGICDK